MDRTRNRLERGVVGRPRPIPRIGLEKESLTRLNAIQLQGIAGGVQPIPFPKTILTCTGWDEPPCRCITIKDGGHQ